MAPSAHERQRAERPLEDVWSSPSRLGQLLRSIPPIGAETIVEAGERLSGALDAAETQAPGSRCYAGRSGFGPPCRQRPAFICALGAGVCPSGSGMGAGWTERITCGSA